jgi:hypothetical protein
VPCGRPQFQLGVTRRAELQQIVVAAVVNLQSGDALRVAAIEAFGQAQDRGERAHGAPRPARQIRETRVLALRRRLAMIPGHECDRFDFVRLEAAQVAVLDHVIRMLVMPLVADMDADVVEDGGVLEPLALAVGEAVDGARLVEERDGEPRDLLRMIRPVVAAFGELEDAAPAHIRVAVGLRDFLAVPRDVVEDQPLAQRQIAQRDLFGVQATQDFVQEDGAGHRQIGAARFEPRHAQTLPEIDCDEILTDAPNLLRCEAPVAQRAARRMPIGRGGHRPEAEDGS